MKVNLKALLLGDDLCLEENLKTTGVLYERQGPDGPLPEDHAVYVLSADISASRMREMHDLLSKKKAVLAPESLRQSFSGDLKDRVRFYPKTCLEAPGGGGRKTFSFSDTAVREEAALSPKKPVRDTLWGLLMEIYAAQGLYCPRLSFYPSGYRTVFAFRVDADEYDRELFGRFTATASKYKSAVSIFFCMASYERCLDEIRRCHQNGFDVHSHAYTHFTYKSYAQNLVNLKKASSFLEKLDIKRTGFASPYGRWNPNLQKAVDEMGYAFSSEFSYDYDNVPSYAVIDGRRSKALQIPVHPIGLGIYMESAGTYDKASVEKYYRLLFEKKYRQGEPILFYDHPTKWLGVYPEFLDFLFSMVASHSDIWVCNMSDWADWWGRREKVNVILHQETGDRSLEWAVGQEGTSSFDKSSLEVFDGLSARVAAIPLQIGKKTENADKMEWHAVPEAEIFDFGAMYRESNLAKIAKTRVKDFLDWETSTPREEIICESVPSGIKSFLRRFKL